MKDYTEYRPVYFRILSRVEFYQIWKCGGVHMRKKFSLRIFIIDPLLRYNPKTMMSAMVFIFQTAKSENNQKLKKLNILCVATRISAIVIQKKT